MKKFTHFEALGLFYGYPPCCITWFQARLEGTIPFELNPNQQKANQYRGFLPCPSCAEKVVNGDAKVEDLITDRLCSEPYPNENCGQSESFLKHLEKKGLLMD